MSEQSKIDLPKHPSPAFQESPAFYKGPYGRSYFTTEQLEQYALDAVAIARQSPAPAPASTDLSEIPDAARQAILLLRSAIEAQVSPSWECNCNHPALQRALDATARFAGPDIGAGDMVEQATVAKEVTDNDELRRAVREMAAALEAREWAEHVSSDPDATALEAGITELVGLYQAARAGAPAALEEVRNQALEEAAMICEYSSTNSLGHAARRIRDLKIERIDRASTTSAERLDPNQVQTVADRIRNTAGLPGTTSAEGDES